MVRGLIFGIWALVFALATSSFVRGQEVVDRIVARVENDIILLSDVRELEEYQELVNGKSESRERDCRPADRSVDRALGSAAVALSRTEGRGNRPRGF